MPKEFFNIAVVYEESERQAVILALAHLAVERPGWDTMLSGIAAKMDNVEGGRPEMYEKFKALTFPEKKAMWAQFHKVWGLAHDGDYQKQEWHSLQDLLTKLFNEQGQDAKRATETAES